MPASVFFHMQINENPKSQYGSQFQNYQKASHRRKPVSRKGRKYWIALWLRLAAWKTALHVRLLPE
jgi:hypothetical protein